MRLYIPSAPIPMGGLSKGHSAVTLTCPEPLGESLLLSGAQDTDSYDPEEIQTSAEPEVRDRDRGSG